MFEGFTVAPVSCSVPWLKQGQLVGILNSYNQEKVIIGPRGETAGCRLSYRGILHDFKARRGK